jgi:penicillin amidase
MVALQNDVLSVPARRIVARLRELPPDTDGLDLLTGWDAVLAPDSAAAALFEVWYRRHLRPALLTQALEPLVGTENAAATAARLVEPEDLLADARVDLDLIEKHQDDTLAEIVARTLPAAVADLEDLLGADRAAWAWGRLHVARAEHPLKALLTTLPDTQLATPTVPRGGSGDTVGNTAYGPNFVQSAGSTFRIVVDVGDWDGALAMNAPGQSGRLDDPHLTDLYTPWSRGEAFPLLYSRDRVTAEAETVIELTPPD